MGGISSAARLAKAGFKVIVVEKNDFTGGRCSLIHNDGYRFDQGETLTCWNSIMASSTDTNKALRCSSSRTSSKKSSRTSVPLWRQRASSY